MGSSVPLYRCILPIACIVCWYKSISSTSSVSGFVSSILGIESSDNVPRFESGCVKFGDFNKLLLGMTLTDSSKESQFCNTSCIISRKLWRKFCWWILLFWSRPSPLQPSKMKCCSCLFMIFYLVRNWKHNQRNSGVLEVSAVYHLAASTDQLIPFWLSEHSGSQFQRQHSF